jgi:hypothetical protein
MADSSGACALDRHCRTDDRFLEWVEDGRDSVRFLLCQGESEPPWLLNGQGKAARYQLVLCQPLQSALSPSSNLRTGKCLSGTSLAAIIPSRVGRWG